MFWSTSNSEISSPAYPALYNIVNNTFYPRAVSVSPPELGLEDSGYQSTRQPGTVSFPQWKSQPPLQPFSSACSRPLKTWRLQKNSRYSH
jgi:hypothetical protein